jgi:TonB family protein
VREALEDLLELSTGFLGLIESRKLDTVALLPPAAFGHPASAPNALYTPADQLVRAPVALKQEAPPFRLRVGGSAIAPPASTGLLEVVIDESGRVEAARLSRGIHPVYDAQLLAAARRWEYTPATKDGKPVRYRKVIEIRVTSDASGR